MPEAAQIREMVESAVSTVFHEEAGKLRDVVIERVLVQLQEQQSAGSNQLGVTAQLQQAFAAIERATTQSDILGALLDGAAAFAARCAIFLVRGESAVGWQALGFGDNDSIRTRSTDLRNGLAQLAVSQGSVVSGRGTDFDQPFMAIIGEPEDSKCAVAPLIVRDKAVALLYADAGRDGGSVDTCALQLLMRIAGLWLEVVAVRKVTAPAIAEPAESAPSTPEDAESASVPESSAPVPETVADPTSQTAPAPVADEETHRKARRFAKLLVEEIKLYNMAKVKDGKQHRNLYARLKDDIEKSRATYDQRYGNSPVAQADYFTQELVRGLADGDPDLFGNNFPR